MRIVTTKLEFCLDFLPATEALEAKLGKDFFEKEGLETAEDLIDFNLIVGNWKNPQAAVIFIKKQPWIIPFEDLKMDLSIEDDPATYSTDLAEANLVVYVYTGNDEELLKAIMKNLLEITEFE